jgi:hypothetical protein
MWAIHLLISVIFNQPYSLSVSNRNRILVGLIVRFIARIYDKLTGAPQMVFAIMHVGKMSILAGSNN